MFGITHLYIKACMLTAAVPGRSPNTLSVDTGEETPDLNVTGVHPCPVRTLPAPDKTL